MPTPSHDRAAPVSVNPGRSRAHEVLTGVSKSYKFVRRPLASLTQRRLFLHITDVHVDNSAAYLLAKLLKVEGIYVE